MTFGSGDTLASSPGTRLETQREGEGTGSAMICGYMMERAREMMLLSAVLLYLANGVCSQGTPARGVATVY